MLKGEKMVKRYVEICNPIEYSTTGTTKIAAKGMIYDYEFYVLDYGLHPCGYVRIPEGHPYFGSIKMLNNMAIRCHGGITYAKRTLIVSPNKMEKLTGWFIGWDYAHSPKDHVCTNENNGGRKWATEEIIKECEDVIRQLIEVAK